MAGKQIMSLNILNGVALDYLREMLRKKQVNNKVRTIFSVRGAADVEEMMWLKYVIFNYLIFWLSKEVNKKMIIDILTNID